MSELFREKSIERINQPEDLDDYIRVTTPSVWIVLIAVVLALAAIVGWMVFGTVDVHNDDGTVTLRFYDDMPSVPYISAAAFQQLMLPGTTIEVSRTCEGTYTLTGPYAEATVNTTTEQFASDDYMGFTNLMDLIQPGMANVYLDGAPYIRYRSMELTPASATVTFDFKKYGIDLRGDDTAVYFPLTTLSDLYSDLYYHVAAYIDGTVVVITDNSNADISKAKRLLGYSPEWSFERGIKEAIEWYKENLK